MVVIRIARGGAGGGESNTISSDGGGLGLTATVPKVGIDLRVRSLAAGAGITVGEAADLITITNVGGAGESNTSSNDGAGDGLAKAKVGVDLPFKSLIDDTEIVITSNANDLTFSIAAAIARIGTAQTWTARQTFQDNGIRIQNPAATFTYDIIGAAIAANRTLTLPLLTGADTMVTQAHAQTLTNKTIDGDDNTIIDINETQMNVSVGASSTVLTSNGVGSAPTYQAGGGGGGLTFAKSVKSSDEIVNNSTTLQDDDQLKFTPTINKTYFIFVFMWYLVDAVSDIKVAASIPAGATTDRINDSTWTANGNASFEDWTVAILPNVGGNGCVQFCGKLVMGGTAGDFIIQWSQRALQVFDTTVLKGSMLVAYEEGTT